MKQRDVKTIGILLLIGILVTWGLAAPAAAMEVKLSGQINHLITNINDGDKEDTFIADNENSGTRFRITGEEDLGPVKAGVQFEFDAQKNSTDKLTIDYDSPNTDGAWDWKERILNAYITTDFGKFEIGQGSGAADGTAESDVSGTSVIIKPDPKITAKSIVWKYDDGSAVTGLDGEEITIGDTRDNFDGLSRNERIRYNTPNFAGVTLSASITNGDAYETALNYSADIGGKIVAAIGYVDSGEREGDDDFTQLSASISWLAPFGLNVTGAYGSRSYENDSVYEATGLEREDATNFYFKLGYKFGIHAVAIEYGANQDLVAEDVTSSNYGAAYVIKPWKPVELYAAYRIYMLDVEEVEDLDLEDINDITQFLAGMRIKF